MNTKAIIPIRLTTLGVIALAYAVSTFTMPGKPIDFPGLHFETITSYFIPPLAAALALAGGFLLLLLKPKGGG